MKQERALRGRRGSGGKTELPGPHPARPQEGRRRDRGPAAGRPVRGRPRRASAKAARPPQSRPSGRRPGAPATPDRPEPRGSAWGRGRGRGRPPSLELLGAAWRLGPRRAHLPLRWCTSTWTVGASATQGRACFRSPTASSMAPPPGAAGTRPDRGRRRRLASRAAATAASALGPRPRFEPAARSAPPSDPEVLAPAGGAPSGRGARFRRGRASSRRRAGSERGLRAAAGLVAALGAAAMGKKHKKHKAEWRSSYEGEAAAALCDAGRAGVRGGGGPGRAAGARELFSSVGPALAATWRRVLNGRVFEVSSRLFPLVPRPCSSSPGVRTPLGGWCRTRRGEQGPGAGGQGIRR